MDSPQYQEDMRRLHSLRTQIVLWLLVLALGVVLIPLMLITGWVRNDVTRLETELLAVQSALSDATTPSEEVMRLTADVARIDQLVSSMQTVTLPSGVNWPQVVGVAGRYDATTIQITSLTQTNNRIQIAGRATSNDAVVRYQQLLLDAGLFDDVVVLSMSTIPPTPTPVVTNEEAAAAPVDVPFGNVEFVMDIVLGETRP